MLLLVKPLAADVRPVSLEIFKRIPVLENGRVKPLDTYARNVLLQLSGKHRIEKKPALRWMADLIFDPERVMKDHIFLINHPSVPEALGLKSRKERRYSFEELEPVLERVEQLAVSASRIKPKDRDLVENEILRLFENLKMYSSMATGLSFAVPHADFVLTNPAVKEQLDLPEDITKFSYLDLVLRAEKLHQLAVPLESMPMEEWNESQKELLAVLKRMFEWNFFYQDAAALAMMPPFDSGEKAWLSPWSALNLGLNLETGRNELFLLRDMRQAYLEGQPVDFDLAVKNFMGSVKGRVPVMHERAINNIGLEILFNRLNLLFWAKTLYFFALLNILASLARINRLLYRIACGLMLTGWLAQLCALGIRMTLLARPPVSNLYETFIFVAFVCVLAGLLIERLKGEWTGLLIGAVSGFIFLTIASKFGMEGDTLQMLVAVLNSNFWLSTHVLSITIGYAGVCLAGVVGHLYVLQCILHARDKKRLQATYQILIGTLAFGLTMTFLGTNLGGIWADQSWGRFWGWDPKENGALLIVIWTAMLFHAKIAKIIGSLGMAVGSILGIVVVMWAWFGVNLLSIGLHSYGFTSGLGLKLMIYVAAQLFFVLVTTPLAYNKLKSHS